MFSIHNFIKESQRSDEELSQSITSVCVCALHTGRASFTLSCPFTSHIYTRNSQMHWMETATAAAAVATATIHDGWALPKGTKKSKMQNCVDLSWYFVCHSRFYHKSLAEWSFQMCMCVRYAHSLTHSVGLNMITLH